MSRPWDEAAAAAAATRGAAVQHRSPNAPVVPVTPRAWREEVARQATGRAPSATPRAWRTRPPVAPPRDWTDARPGRPATAPEPEGWDEPSWIRRPEARQGSAPRGWADDRDTAAPDPPPVWNDRVAHPEEAWADDGRPHDADGRDDPDGWLHDDGHDGYDRDGYDHGRHRLHRGPVPVLDEPDEVGQIGEARRAREAGHGDRRRPRRSADRRTEPTAPGTVDHGPRLPHVPGFDGLRAVALLAVLAFHQGYDLVSGGFLGISSFFTLSGFLIATLLLAEWAQGGAVSLPRFWERRARRLIPPVVVVLAVVVALQTALRVGAGPGFRGDVLAAAGQVLNWRFAIGGDGFASVLTDPSPVQHLWSVSIAAQVFLLFPLAFIGLMRVAGRRWRAAGAVFALAAVGSFLAAAATADRAGNDGFAYYGTHTRIGEVLVGVALAYAVLSPGVRRLMDTRRGAVVMRYGPLVALAGLAWLWSTTSLYSSNLFGGVTAVNALLTGFVVLAVTAPGPATTALGSLPLRTLGRISYAAYLVHWPIFLLLDEDRTGLDSHTLFLARLVATLAVAALSTWALERPIRYRLAVSRGQLGLALGTSLALVAAAGLVLPEQPPPDVSLAVDNGEDPGDLEAVAPAGGGDEIVRIALVGDGLAATLTAGLDTWNADQADQQMRVDTHVAAGCPISAPGPVRLAGETVGEGIACVGFRPRLPKLLDASGADAIVVVGGLADLGEREIDRKWRHIGDPVFDDWLADRYDDLADTLAEQDVPVLWATYPHVRLAPGNDGEGDWTSVEDNDPLRVERLNEIIRGTVAGRDDFSVIDLDAWTQDLPNGGAFNAEYRLEGRDLTEAGAAAAARWLVPKVLEATGTEPPASDSGDTESDDADSTTTSGAG
ncbi:MAG TPA: acyltransferase family protein [Acidimicrobiales bacterium]|nr:acyltransferase family protein [Acidimicrobiales bacterium]